MLKHCLLALMLAGLFYTVSPAVAQDSGSAGQEAPPSGARPEHGPGRFDPASRTEMLTRQLKLTSDQQSKVLDIYKSAQSQMESLHSDTSTPQDERRSKIMEIHKSTNDQVRAILDPNQQKKWDTMQSHHEHWQGHQPGGQAPPPDSSEPK